MLQFRKIEMKDKRIIEKYLKLYDFVTCYYSFNSMFLWRDYYKLEVAFENDSMYVKVGIDNEIKFYIPFSKDLDLGVEKLKKYTDDINIPLIFTFVEDNFKKILEAKYNVSYINVRERANYIYSIEELAMLEGKKFKQKRNFVNSFKSNNLLCYEFGPIENGNKNEYIEFLDKWYKENDDGSESLKNEKKAVLEAIDNYEELELQGAVLYLDSELIALTIGTINCEILDVHFEKANIEHRGAYQMINYLFSNLMLKKVKYLNREEDLGHPGLRQAKMSYNPIFLGENYDVIVKNRLE